MAELIADLFVSVDGFAAGENCGPFFGYGAPDLEQWITTEAARPEVILMGRVTYELMADRNPDSPLRSARKAVFSNRLQEPLKWDNTLLLSGDPASAITAFKRESDVRIRSIGSISLVRSLLELDLVDQLRLAIFPLAVGPDGREPAYLAYPRRGFRLVDTTVLDSQVVVLTYEPESGTKKPGA